MKKDLDNFDITFELPVTIVLCVCVCVGGGGGGGGMCASVVTLAYCLSVCMSISLCA